MAVFTDSLRKDISALYAAILGRLPDGQGLDYWEVRVKIYNWDMRTLAENMLFAAVNDPRTKDLYAKYNDTLELVMAIYKNVFGKSYSDDPEGIAYWVREIEEGRTTKGRVIADIVYAAVTKHKDDPATKALLNRAEAGVKFAQANPTVILDTNGDGKISADEMAPYESYLQMITSDPASIDAALNKMQSEVATGKVFTLTVGVDILSGTSGNDIFIADNTVTTQLTSADQINGGAGIDILKIYQPTDTDLSTTVLGQLRSIEKLYVYGGKLENGNTWDISGVSGLESLEIDSPAAMSADSTFTFKTGASQVVTLKNVTGPSTGTSTVKINGATTVILNKFDTNIKLDIAGSNTALTIKTTGAPSNFTLDNSGNKLETLTISGDQKITIRVALSNLKTIDASGNSGGVTIDMSSLSNNNNLTFKGGAGNDTLIFRQGHLTKDDNLDGGPGKDTIVINDATPNYSAINATKNFEVLAVNADNTVVDIAEITNGINEFAVRAGNISATFNNALSTSKFYIDLTGGNNGTITISNKVGEMATSVVLDNQGGGNQQLNNLVLTGAATIYLTATTRSSNDTIEIKNFSHNDNANIVVTGNASKLKFTVSGTNTGSKVDASAFTGNLEVIASGKGDVLIGGSGDDIFVSQGKDTMTGGAGKDTFDVSQAYDTGQDIDVTITDFSVGDKIVFKNQGTEHWFKDKVDVTGATTLLDAIRIAASGDGGTNALIKWFQYGGNTYIVQDMTNGEYNPSSDLVIKLTGLVDLSSATFDSITNTMTLS